MARQVNVSSLGLEITEDYLLLSQMTYEDEGVTVDRVWSVAIPPRTVVNGQIADPATLSDQLMKVLAEASVESSNVIVTINGVSFLQQLDWFSDTTETYLRQEIEGRLSDHYLFSEADFEYGFQFPTLSSSDKDETAKLSASSVPVMYAAVEESTIASIRELVEMADLYLVSIEIPSISLLRVMLLSGVLAGTLSLVMVVETKYILLKVVYDSTVLLVQTIRISYDELIHDDILRENFGLRVKRFALAFFNEYMQFDEFDQCLYFSRVDSGDRFYRFLEDVVVDFTFSKFDPKPVFKIQNQSAVYSGCNHTFLESLASLGAAQKYFEDSFRTLGLVKVRRQIGPIVNKWDLGVALLVFLGVFLIYSVISFYLGKSIETLNQQVVVVKRDIQSLQSGEYLSRQKQLEGYFHQIRFYSGLKKNLYSRSAFIHDLVERLPKDMYIDNWNLSDDRRFTLSATAYSQESVFEYYLYLQENFDRVDLSGLSIDYEDEDVMKNTFKFSFDWK